MATLAGQMAWKRITQAISTKINPKASDFQMWAESQQARLTLKQGTPRAPGSNHPHVELKNAKGSRIDLQGKLVNRKTPANHTPIDWDI